MATLVPQYTEPNLITFSTNLSGGSAQFFATYGTAPSYTVSLGGEKHVVARQEMRVGDVLILRDPGAEGISALYKNKCAIVIEAEEFGDRFRVLMDERSTYSEDRIPGKFKEWSGGFYGRPQPNAWERVGRLDPLSVSLSKSGIYDRARGSSVYNVTRWTREGGFRVDSAYNPDISATYENTHKTTGAGMFSISVQETIEGWVGLVRDQQYGVILWQSEPQTDTVDPETEKVTVMARDMAQKAADEKVKEVYKNLFANTSAL